MFFPFLKNKEQGKCHGCDIKDRYIRLDKGHNVFG